MSEEPGIQGPMDPIRDEHNQVKNRADVLSGGIKEIARQSSKAEAVANLDPLSAQALSTNTKPGPDIVPKGIGIKNETVTRVTDHPVELPGREVRDTIPYEKPETQPSIVGRLLNKVRGR